jgi:hypothetical protein
VADLEKKEPPAEGEMNRIATHFLSYHSFQIKQPMTRGQFIGMITTAILLTIIASSKYLVGHRYQITASKEFFYIFDFP